MMGSRIREDGQLFEVFVEAMRVIHDDGQVDIKLMFIHPSVQQDLLNSVSKFVFPFGSSFKSNSVDCFTFVLTDGDGSFKFGFCRLSNNSTICHCLISCYPWFGVFYSLLNFLTELKKTEDMQIFLNVINSLLAISHFSPGKCISSKVEPQFEFVVPDPNQLMTIPASINLTEYFCAVDVKHMMEIFASTLLERRIIVVSKRLSRLTACVHTASSFLFPFHWQHIFIPILPPHLLDYCSAPMPFLIGVHSSLWSKINKEELGEVLILDADDNSIHSSFNDLNRFPQTLVSHLKKNLGKGKSCCSKGDLIPRAFLKVLASLFGGYRVAFKTEQGKIVFDADAFVLTRPAAYHSFLRYSLQLQIFQQFIEERLVLLNSGKTFSDIFEEEIKNIEDQNRLKEKNSKKLDNKFMKMLNKADKSRFTTFFENVVGGCSSSAELNFKHQKSQTSILSKKILQKFPRKLSVNLLGDKMKNASDAQRQLSSSSSSDGFFKHLESSLPLAKDVRSLGDMDFCRDKEAEQHFKSDSVVFEYKLISSSFEAFDVISQDNKKSLNHQVSHSLEDVTREDGNGHNPQCEFTPSLKSQTGEDIIPSDDLSISSSSGSITKSTPSKLQHLIDLYEKKKESQPRKTDISNPIFPGTYFPPHLGSSSIAARRANLQASTEQWKRNYRSRNISDVHPNVEGSFKTDAHSKLKTAINIESVKATEMTPVVESFSSNSSMQNGISASPDVNIIKREDFAIAEHQAVNRVTSCSGLSRRKAFKANKSQSSSESKRSSAYRASLKESVDKKYTNEQRYSPLLFNGEDGDNDFEEENSADDAYSTPPTHPNSMCAPIALTSNLSQNVCEAEQRSSNLMSHDTHKLKSDDNSSIDSRASSYSSLLSECNEVHKPFLQKKPIGGISLVHPRDDNSTASLE